MAVRVPQWQLTKNRRLAVFIACGWMIAGLGELASGILSGRAFLIALGSFYLLFGSPWYITAIVLLRRRNAARGEADRRVGELLTSFLCETDRAEIDTVLAHGRFRHAVRRVRETTGLSLVDAKRVVESIRR